MRVFVAERLDEEEGALFAALVAPGVALAYPEDEVAGFAADWRPNALPDTLAEELRVRSVWVEHPQE